MPPLYSFKHVTLQPQQPIASYLGATNLSNPAVSIESYSVFELPSPFHGNHLIVAYPLLDCIICQIKLNFDDAGVDQYEFNDVLQIFSLEFVPKFLQVGRMGCTGYNLIFSWISLTEYIQHISVQKRHNLSFAHIVHG